LLFFTYIILILYMQ